MSVVVYRIVVPCERMTEDGSGSVSAHLVDQVSAVEQRPVATERAV